MSSSFFKTIEDPENGWMWNGKPIKMLGGAKVQTKEKN